MTLAKPMEVSASRKSFGCPAKREFVSLLRQLKADLRIHDMDPDKDRVTLSIDDYIVSIRLVDAREIELTAAEHVEVNDEALLKEVLVGNLMGHATGGGMLAVCDQWLTLTRRLPLASLDYRMFADAVESFVNHWEYWHKRLHVTTKLASPRNTRAFFSWV